MRTARLLLLLALLAVRAPASPAAADPAFAKLDFWLGEWRMVETESGRPAGTNRIEKILGGCAVSEHWIAPDGRGEGRSLFWYNPATGLWRQVWVTNAGRSKEKQLVAELPDGGLRFQGEVAQPGGGSVLDRTTLTPLPDGRVRQRIEISPDRGATWRPVFDATYVRADPAAP